MKDSGVMLLEERIESIPILLRNWGVYSEAISLELRNFKAPTSFVVTGIGSSEAHARYLALLLERYAGIPACFQPLSTISAHARPDACLVVFSQGLSPNSFLALNSRSSFESCILCTAVTEEGAARRNPGLHTSLQQLVTEGVKVIRFPLEDEFSILIRVVGPFFGFLAAYELVRSLNAEKLPLIDLAELSSRVTASKTKSQAFLAGCPLETLRFGFHLLCSKELSQISKNLCLKFLEGLYFDMPHSWDVLDLSHGLLQQLSVGVKPVWLLSAEGEITKTDEAAVRCLTSIGVEPYCYASAYAWPLAVLEFEALLNYVVLAGVRQFGIDQLEWPAKGKDAPLYDKK